MFLLFLHAVATSLFNLITWIVPNWAIPQSSLRESLLIFQVVFPSGFCLSSSSLPNTLSRWRLEMPGVGWPCSGHCPTKETFRTGEVCESDWNRFDLQPDRLQLYCPLQHWSTWYDKSLLGCIYHDLHYQSHTGNDFPVNEGTLMNTTIGEEVAWAGSNNLRGNLVVFENNDYRVWLAHLSAITISKGYILHYRKVCNCSGMNY